MPPGKIQLKTGVEARTRGTACTKRIFAEADPRDFTSRDGTAAFSLAELRYKMHAPVFFGGFCGVACLPRVLFQKLRL